MARVASRGTDQFVVRFPDGLRDRIRDAAEKSGRSMNAEIVATLEEAYPAPTPTRPLLPFSDQEMFVLQWSAGRWHPVDWDQWVGFRTDMHPTRVDDLSVDGNNYFVVVVFDDAGTLVNIIVHNYLISNGKSRSAGFELLSEEEIEEYEKLMTAPTATESDTRRLRKLQDTMEPAFVLPANSIPKLIEVLEYFCPRETVEDVLQKRGIFQSA